MPINNTSPTGLTSSVLIADILTNGSEPRFTTVGGIPVSAAVEIQSTTGSLLIPRMNNAQRDALPVPVNGMIIYNNNAGKNIVEVYAGGAWVAVGLGTVTSVGALSLSNGLTIGGGPITTFGTFSFSLDASINNLTTVVTNGILVKTNATSYLSRTLVSASSSRITISNSDGVVGNPVFDLGTTGITSGNYNFPPAISVDVYGRITAISGGTAPVLISGSTMSGPLILSGNPTDPLGATPKQYVDAISAGLQVKQSAYASTTSNLNALYNNGVAGVGATLTNNGALAVFSVDGVSPPINSRILVKNQSTAFQCGIYTLTTVGSGAVAWILTRSTDYNTPAQIHPGDLVIIDNGITLTNSGWVETSTVNTIGVDSISFSQFGTSVPILEIIAQNELFVGTNAGSSNAISLRNTGMGDGGVLNSIVGASDNCAYGHQAGKNTTISVNGCFFGSGAGKNNVSANSSIAIGFAALQNNTIQDSNIAIGDSALKALNDNIGISSQNIFIGQHAGQSILNGINNIGIGASVMSTVTTGNTGVISIGQLAFNALNNSTGSLALGIQSGLLATQGNYCTFAGANSGSANTLYTNCTLIGAKSDTGVDNLTNAGAFGYQSSISLSNAINLGNGCTIGINNSSPSYNLDIASITGVSSLNLSIGTSVPPTTTGALTFTYTAQTVNTSNLGLPLFTLPTNKSAVIEVMINGATTTLLDFTGGNLVAGVMRAAGNISLVGASYNKIVSTTGDFSISVNTGTQTVILNATGIAASTYNWTIAVKYQIF